MQRRLFGTLNACLRLFNIRRGKGERSKYASIKAVATFVVTMAATVFLDNMEHRAISPRQLSFMSCLP